MREAEEGKLYIQHSFSHWVLMRLHISSRKDIYRRIRGGPHVCREHAGFEGKKRSERRRRFDMIF